VKAAPSQAPAQFEVASVKANTSGDGKVAIQMLPGGRFIATNATLRQLIRNAYQLQEFQITGGPSWLDRDRFDCRRSTPRGRRSSPPSGSSSGSSWTRKRGGRRAGHRSRGAAEGKL